MPAGIDYAISYDTAPFVKVSIEKVAQTLAEAMVLVVIVLRLKDGLKIPALRNCLTLTGASLMNLGAFFAFSFAAASASRRGAFC